MVAIPVAHLLNNWLPAPAQVPIHSSPTCINQKLEQPCFDTGASKASHKSSEETNCDTFLNYWRDKFMLEFSKIIKIEDQILPIKYVDLYLGDYFLAHRYHQGGDVVVMPLLSVYGRV